MATSLEMVRRLAAEPTAESYTDAQIADRLTAADGDVNTVVRDIWQEKAAALTELVDISEGGSSRRNSQAYEHAITMYNMYAGLVERLAANGVRIRRLTR